MDHTQPRSRRSILAAGLGAAGGAIAMSLGRPLPADATVATMQTGADNTSDATTRLLRSTLGTALSISPSGMPAFEHGQETVAIGTNAFKAPALNVVSTNDDDGIAMLVSADGDFADGIVVTASHTGIKATATREFAYGVIGIATGGEEATGVSGFGQGSSVGGVFESEQGLALLVYGRAKFSRSGRALVPKGRSYVDITVPGGMSSTTSSVLATIQGYASGAAVSGVRPNYPSSGKARIYLTKIASTTASTPVGWLVIG